MAAYGPLLALPAQLSERALLQVAVFAVEAVEHLRLELGLDLIEMADRLRRGVGVCARPTKQSRQKARGLPWGCGAKIPTEPFTLLVSVRPEFDRKRHTVKGAARYAFDVRPR